LEAEAASSLEWQVEIVPGLLQTEDYARSVFLGYQSVVPIAPGVVERRVEVRTLRQKVLIRDPPIQLSVVLDEAVLLRRIGTNELMHAQLQHLVEVASLPNVDLRVLPLHNDRAMLANSFVLFSFSDATLHDVVSTESVKSGLYVEDESDTYLYRLFFESLAGSSLSSAESVEMIRQTAERFWA
jgi:hypothetical protein